MPHFTFPLISRQHRAVLARHKLYNTSTTLFHSFNPSWTSSGHSRPSLGKLSSPRLSTHELHASTAPARSTSHLSNRFNRTITALAVVVSAAGYGGIIDLTHFIFASQAIFTMRILPQIWRIFTAFLITKPKFAILLDPYFLYQYGSGLERESPRFAQPGDFATYTAFVGGVIVVSGIAFLLLDTTSATFDASCTSISTFGAMTARLRPPRNICPPSHCSS